MLQGLEFSNRLWRKINIDGREGFKKKIFI